jgi:acyl dehydratase
MSEKIWAYEDFEEGISIPLGSKLVSAEEIIEFAGEFDPQPFHLDEEAGRASILGGLSASGWHTSCIFIRLLCDSFLLDSTSEGSPGVDQARWRKPVLAGNTLAGRSIVLSKRELRSRPNLGIVTFRHELFNQRSEAVFELLNAIMFRKRSAA